MTDHALSLDRLCAKKNQVSGDVVLFVVLCLCCFLVCFVCICLVLPSRLRSFELCVNSMRA